MSSALTFGVELEFLMAYLPDNTSPPDPSETRLLRFEYTEADIAAYHHMTIDTSNARDTDENGGRFICAKCHIRNALSAVGLPIITIHQAEHDHSSFSGWDIVKDTSIEKPSETPYGYFQLEVRSPAYIFTPSALLEVRLACQTLLSNFCILAAVETSSLHVHVGDGGRGFDAVTMRKLAAFTWAFEPQLDSLHPPHKQTTYHATGMRTSSRYSRRYGERCGYVYDPRISPSGITGALDLLACEDIESLCELVKDELGYLKTCRVSFSGILGASRDGACGCGCENGKRTVEWRQHAGTLDGEEVTMWIQTVVGIMCFIRDASVCSFLDVLALALLETWQKVGDGRDGARERELGPVLAEGVLTVDRLLRILMLDEQAAFYRRRWFRLPKMSVGEARKSRMVRAYKEESVPGSEEFVRCAAMRRLWEDLYLLRDLEQTLSSSSLEAPGLVAFDPESSMWPSHSLRVVSPSESGDEDEFSEEDDDVDTLGDLGAGATSNGETEIKIGEEGGEEKEVVES
ncbi:hypothetical protein IFR05_004513 [Cadophora sp. M221]|nr:hypothetical protein IFR05_004513 [Cadophora sp. M221]